MDLQIFRLFNSLVGRSRFLDWLIVGLAQWLAYLLVLAVLLYWVWRKNKANQVVIGAFIAAIIARFGFTEIIRFFYDRPRPLDFASKALTHGAIAKVGSLISHSSGHSFPSGHAAFFFALSTAVYLHDKKTGSVFITASLLMGLARIAAGLHWPSDILGGAAVGTATAILIDKLVNKWWRGS